MTQCQRRHSPASFPTQEGIKVHETMSMHCAGEFQCYDEYMLSMLHAAALQTGHAEYGHGGPHDAGSYCQWPQQTKFFRCASVSTSFALLVKAPAVESCGLLKASHHEVNRIMWGAGTLVVGLLSTESSSSTGTATNCCIMPTRYCRLRTRFLGTLQCSCRSSYQLSIGGTTHSRMR